MEGLDSIYTEKFVDEWSRTSCDWERSLLIRNIVGLPFDDANIILSAIVKSRASTTHWLMRCLMEHNLYKSLRYLLDMGCIPTPTLYFYDFTDDHKGFRVLIDYGMSAKDIPKMYSKARKSMIKFHASRKRARLGAIAVISAIARRRRSAAAAEGGITPYSKDVALIIARVVWESRGFYSLVSRRHFARRK